VTDTDPRPDGDENPTAEFHDPADAVGELLAGKYKLLQKIGEGGMGAVYLARQFEPVRREVAVKIILPGMDSKQVLARFEAERQALAMLDHPNIARVLDAGTTERRQPFFVMELIRGVPITQFCNERRLGVRARLDLFIQVCHAIQHAHQKGIIHRDVKPSNVLVALYDDKPVPKVIDFGVAKATTQPLTERTMFTQYGALVGTIEYMSPEQAQFNHLDIDTRTDIYSLGVLLYELLTGGTPFERKRLRSAAFDEVLRIIREEEPPTPSKRLSTIDELPSIAAERSLEPKRLGAVVRGDLDWIVMKCLEKERSRRYDAANGLAADLLHYLADEPVTAGPPRAGYRLRKFLRRHRGPVLAGVLLFGTIVAGAVVGISQAIRATGAERLAKKNEKDALGEREAALKSAEGERKAREVAERLAAKTAIEADLTRLAKDNVSVGLLNLAATLAALPPHASDFRASIAANILLAGQEDCPLPPLLHDGFTPTFSELNKGATLVLTWGGDDSVRLWDVLTGKQRAVLQHPGPVDFARFTEDGRSVVSFDNVSRKVRLWDAATGAPRFASPQHRGAIHRATFSESGHRIATLSDDVPAFEVLSLGAAPKGTFLQVFDAGVGVLLGDVEGVAPTVDFFVMDPKGRNLATKLSPRVLRIYSLARRLPTRDVAIASGENLSGDFSPNGTRFGMTSTVGGSRIFTAWDANRWSKLCEEVVDGVQVAAHWLDDSTVMIPSKTICFDAPEDKPLVRDLLALKRKDDLFMTVSGDIVDVKAGLLVPPRGTRFHPATANFAIDGRWLPLTHVTDLTTQVDVGVDSQLNEDVAVHQDAELKTDGEAIKLQLFDHATLPASSVQRTYLRLLPLGWSGDSGELLTLYCHLVAGGTLLPDGKINPFSEEEWTRHCDQFRVALESKRKQLPPTVYRVLAAVCQDPHYWLRQQLRLNSLRVLTVRRDASSPTFEALWSELLKREPAWWNFHDRAFAPVVARQTVPTQQMEFLLSAWKLGGVRYRDLMFNPLVKTVGDVVLNAPRDGKDYREAVAALLRLQAEIHDQRRPAVVRLAALNAFRARNVDEADRFAAEYERKVFQNWRGAIADAVRRKQDDADWDDYLTMKERACVSACFRAMLHHLRGDKSASASFFRQADDLRRELRTKTDRDRVFQETFEWTERFLRGEIH